MKKILLMACFMMSSMMALADMPGSPCTRADGSTCHRGTRDCTCQHPGGSCTSVTGGTCQSGTQGCTCASH